jgi:hypothetical protein
MARRQSETPNVNPNLNPDGNVPDDDAVIGRAFQRSLIVIGVIVLLVVGVVFALRDWGGKVVLVQTAHELPRTRDLRQTVIPPLPFTDITRSAGVSFVHTNGALGEKRLPETMGGGVAVFDFDNDLDQDILFINSTWWPGSRIPAGADPNPTCVLYANDGKGAFTDVSAAAGLNVSLYGMGVACGDFDNDGWVDVYITAVGTNRLLRNNQGKFVDVTDAAGVAGLPNLWGTAACWFDMDNDGDLDLFVANYLEWSAEIDRGLNCTLSGSTRAYCRPQVFAGQYPLLYRNEGDGKFTDISAEAGVQVKNPNTGVPLPKTLGIAPVDVDGDGWVDLVIANDTVQNLLFRNVEGRGFEEIGAQAGIAVDNSGQARGAMGIDAAHPRNDDMLAVVIGNFTNEMTALYCTQSRSPVLFTDDAVAAGIGPESRLLLKFGIFFFDADLDGRLDVLAVNGHLEDEINKVQPSQTYEQQPQLFWNAGPDAPTEYVHVPSRNTGAEFAAKMVGRGSAYGDFDGDGDLDVVMTAVHGPPRLLRNDQATGRHWIRIKLVGTRCNRDALGAWVFLHAGQEVQRRQICATRSYLSQSELPATFGLGSSTGYDKIEIVWPDGSRQEVTGLEVDRMHTITQPDAR